MSLINKLAKYGAVAPLPNGGGGREIGARALGPPTYMGDARRAMLPGGYMGDPGIFGSIFKGLKSIAGFGTGIVSKLGIPVVSGVAGMVGSRFFGRAGIPGASTQPIYQIPGRIPPAPVAMPGGIVLGARGGGFPPTIGPGLPMRTAPPELSMGTAGGYHLNKSSYFLMDGTFIERGTKWVKNRRRNPGNMKALSRSLGRIKSAKKMATVLGTISIRSACPAPRRKKK